MPNALPIRSWKPHSPRPAVDEARLRWRLAGGWGMLILIMVLAIAAVVLVSVVAFRIYRNCRFNMEGQEIIGRIHTKRISVARSGKGVDWTTYYIRYSFRIGPGQRFEDEESISAKVYNAVQAGQSHPVEYLSSNPTVHRLKVERGIVSELVMSSIAVLLVIGSYWMFRRSRNNGRRRAYIIFHGKNRPGQILVSEQRGTGKNREYVLMYRYIDLNGDEQTSEDLTLGAKMIQRFPIGTLVTVMIDPNEPSRPELDLYGVHPAPAIK